jgi:hypothetical protein
MYISLCVCDTNYKKRGTHEMDSYKTYIHPIDVLIYGSIGSVGYNWDYQENKYTYGINILAI